MRFKNAIIGVLILILGQGLYHVADALEQNFVPPEVISDYFDMAQNYKDSGNYQKALDYITMIINYEPQNSQAKYEKAYLLKLLNRSSEAKIVFIEALELNSEYEKSELAKEFFEQNKVEEKKVEIEAQNTGSEVYDSDYYLNEGVKYLDEHNKIKATDFFRKAIKLNPKNAPAYNYLGVIYWQDKYYKIAEKQFMKAYCLDKTNPKPLLNLALLHKETGNLTKYRYYLYKAEKIAPKDALTKWCLGNYNFENGKISSSIDYYTKSIEIDSKFTTGYISLGNTLFNAGKYEEAYAIYNKALAISPNDAELNYMAAKTALLLQKCDEALALINNAIKINKDSKYTIELAKINYLMENIPEALKGFESIAKENQNAEVLNYIGLCYYKQKEAQKALDYFKKVIEVETTKPNYYYNLAQCYKTLGDKRAFFKYLDMATKITPKNPQDYIEMSYIYFDNGSKTMALNVLNEGIEKFPEDKKLYLVKLTLYKTIGDMNNYVSFKEIFDAKFNK